MTKDNVKMEDFDKVTLGLDVVKDKFEKIKNDNLYEENTKHKENIQGSEYLSYQNDRNKHNSYLKDKKYERRVSEKEIQLVGVPKEELLKSKKPLKKFNRRTKKIQQQEKKESIKVLREQSKNIERKYI